MYLDYYNLNEKPFQISSDPKFLWFGEKHKEAYAVLRYGILANKGVLLLTGGVGTGKTTLVNALTDSFEKGVVHATISNSRLEIVDFYILLANAFRLKGKFDRKSRFLLIFEKLMEKYRDKGKKVLLIVDEAQSMPLQILEEIRLLSNMEKDGSKLLNIFFVGQNEFNEILWKSENDALRQRITIGYNIQPLEKNETAEYIRHRLNVAGSAGDFFTAGAIRRIYSFSKGYPRLINILCDHALLSGFVKNSRKIDKKIIKECEKELRIPKKGKLPDTPEKQIRVIKGSETGPDPMP